MSKHSYKWSANVRYSKSVRQDKDVTPQQRRLQLPVINQEERNQNQNNSHLKSCNIRRTPKTWRHENVAMRQMRL